MAATANEQDRESPISAGYCRVSGDRQAKSGLGLEGQDLQIQEYHERVLAPKSIPLARTFVDPAISAAKRPFLERPQGIALNEYVRPGDHIIFAKMDRCFRNLADYATNMQRWAKEGVFVHIINTGLDTSDPKQLAGARMISGVFASFAEYESHMIGQRKREANVIARIQGRPTNHRVKPGWKIVGPPGLRRIVPNEEERATMRLIVELRDGGMSFGAISNHLIAKRVFWKKPGRKAPGGYTLELWDRQRCRRGYEEMVRIEEDAR